MFSQQRGGSSIRQTMSAFVLGCGFAIVLLSLKPAVSGTSLAVTTSHTTSGVKAAILPKVSNGASGVGQYYLPAQIQRTAAPVKVTEQETPVGSHWNVPGALLGVLLTSLSIIGLITPASPAMAFDNAVPEAAQYSNAKKSPGEMPKDLGLLPRKQVGGKLGLKECAGAPNCFSTSGPDANHQVDPWVPPAGVAPEEALSQLKAVVERYPPFQQEIDGGGFKIIKSEPNYLYAQFESLQNGFIDDVEFAVNPNGPGILFRSSSRMGYLDISVNAKRLNWISAELRKLGWTAPELARADHPFYFKMNTFDFFGK